MRLVLVALAAVRLVAAGDTTLDLLPANTKVVFGIRLSAIGESAAFKDTGTGAQNLGEEWSKLVAFTGFDPLHDIDEVLVGSPADKENAPALLVLRGRFDLARMGVGAPRYHGVAMVGDGKGGKSVLALLDAATVVAGDAPAVHAAIGQRGQGAGLDVALIERLQSLRERFDIWGTGERPEGFVPPTGKNEGLDSMDRFEFGIRMSKGFELGAEMHARSLKDAEKLAASMEALQAMMTMSGRDQAGTKLDVQVKDGTVKISLAISEDELKKAIAAQRLVSAPKGGAPVVVNSGTSVTLPAVPDGNSGGTSVFVLPGKK
jgi:hypothetical protein